MKKGFAVFAVVLFLLSTQVTHAANLEEGWYVNLQSVTLWWDDELGYAHPLDWQFTDVPSVCGPFTVTDPGLQRSSRIISVTADAAVPAATEVTLSGVPANPVSYCITRIDVALETNYDATQMVLNVLAFHAGGGQDLLWTQTMSGHLLGMKTIYPMSFAPISGDSLIFRVIAVPEPASMLSLALPLLVVTSRLRRKIAR